MTAQEWFELELAEIPSIPTTKCEMIRRNAYLAADEALDHFKREAEVKIEVYRNFLGNKFVTRCPRCGASLERYHIRQDTNYCFSCGQKLDWSMYDNINSEDYKIVWKVEKNG